MGAEYLFYMKSIETHARAFLSLIILGIGTVNKGQKDSKNGAARKVHDDLRNGVHLFQNKHDLI